MSKLETRIIFAILGIVTAMVLLTAVGVVIL